MDKSKKIVSLKLALKLRNFGYNEKCTYKYSIADKKITSSVTDLNYNSYSSYISVPYVDEAASYFRDNLNMFIEISYKNDLYYGGHYNYKVIDLETITNGSNLIISQSKDEDIYSTYEKALNAAMLDVLNQYEILVQMQEEENKTKTQIEEIQSSLEEKAVIATNIKSISC